MNAKTVTMRVVAAAIVAIATVPLAANAALLYGATRGDASNTSFLYSIDTATGAATLVGDIGFSVNGLTYDATTATMYATTSQSAGGSRLITISTLTGAGTAIGPTGLFATWGVTANSSGGLYAWTEGTDDAVVLDPATGAGTALGDSGVSTAGATLAFSNDDVLTLVQTLGVYHVDTSTGAATLQGTLTGLTDDFHHGDFHPDANMLWMVNGEGTTLASALVIYDMSSLAFTDSLDLSGISEGTADLHTIAFVDVAPIPIPAALPLLLSGLGLLGLSGLRRRR